MGCGRGARYPLDDLHGFLDDALHGHLLDHLHHLYRGRAADETINGVSLGEFATEFFQRRHWKMERWTSGQQRTFSIMRSMITLRTTCFSTILSTATFKHQKSCVSLKKNLLRAICAEESMYLANQLNFLVDILNHWLFLKNGLLNHFGSFHNLDRRSKKLVMRIHNSKKKLQLNCFDLQDQTLTFSTMLSFGTEIGDSIARSIILSMEITRSCACIRTSMTAGAGGKCKVNVSKLKFTVGTIFKKLCNRYLLS